MWTCCAWIRPEPSRSRGCRWRKSCAGAGGNLRELDLLLADYAAAIEDNNATMQAIREYVTGLSQREDLGEGIGENACPAADRAAPAPRIPLATLPFSSSRK